MENIQPVEKLLDHEGLLEIHSVWRTIQGEGPFVGLACLFVRFAGCNLQCPMCDTDYTSRRAVVPVDQFVELCQERGNGLDLVVLTGGEPLRQGPALYSFIRQLWNIGKRVQIETNGTYSIDREYLYDRRLTVVCSPKTPHIKVHPHAFKYVLDSSNVSELDGLPTSVLGRVGWPARPTAGFPRDLIYLQPADEQDPEKNQANIEAVKASCMEFGYRFSFQVHKHIGSA